MNLTNLIPALHQESEELTGEARMRRDVLFTQLRAKTGLSAENIDLSEVDLEADDDALKAQVAKARGLKNPDLVDLDEVILPSGAARRRVRRTMQRAEAKRRRRGQTAYRRQQRARRRIEVPRESGSSLVKQRRALKAELAERRKTEDAA